MVRVNGCVRGYVYDALKAVRTVGIVGRIFYGSRPGRPSGVIAENENVGPTVIEKNKKFFRGDVRHSTERLVESHVEGVEQFLQWSLSPALRRERQNLIAVEQGDVL